MKTVAFANGDQMPILGLGTWKAPPGVVYDAVREALRVGYRHFDCAAIYGNEAEIGNALQDADREGEVGREQLWVTSKLWNNAHSDVTAAIQQTLRNLRLDYLDLYLIHWPVALRPEVDFPRSGADILAPAEAPTERTWARMEAAHAAGLARHIGLSNFSIKKVAALLAHCSIKPEVNQVERHPFLAQSELVSYCASEGIHITAYSPLGSPDRPTQLKGAQEPSLLKEPTIVAIAEEHGCTPAQVLLAWHMQRGVSVIPKSVTPSRLRENLAAVELSLSASAMQRIAQLDRRFRYLDGSIWTFSGSPYTRELLWDDDAHTA
ncbi:MAG TPA: aldo/keto reductase [Polyangiales bacterium]